MFHLWFKDYWILTAVYESHGLILCSVTWGSWLPEQSQGARETAAELLSTAGGEEGAASDMHKELLFIFGLFRHNGHKILYFFIHPFADMILMEYDPGCTDLAEGFAHNSRSKQKHFCSVCLPHRESFVEGKQGCGDDGGRSCDSNRVLQDKFLLEFVRLFSPLLYLSLTGTRKSKFGGRGVHSYHCGG